MGCCFFLFMICFFSILVLGGVVNRLYNFYWVFFVLLEINEAFKDVDNFATMLYNIVKTFFNRKEVKT